MNPNEGNTAGLEAALASIAAAIAKQDLSTINVSRQNDTSNSQVNGARVEMGWGFIPNNTGSAAIAETVVFSKPFSSTPIIIVSLAGDHPSAQTYGSGNNNVEGRLTIKSVAQRAQDFGVYIHTGGANSFGSGYTFYTWIAMGN